MALSDNEQEGLHRLEVVEHLQPQQRHQQRHQRRHQQRRLHNRTEKKFRVEKKT